MKQQIAVNSKHTGDRRKDHRGYAETWTSEQHDGLLSEDWLRRMVAAVRGGDERQKDGLPYICPHYSAFRDNHRAQADIIPEAFTFMTCVDVDDPGLVDKAIGQALAVNGDEYSDWQDQVLRIEYSARRKVHIYIRIPKGMTIEEAQQAFCKEIGVPYDESCITPERYIYVTGIDEEVYRSAHWLEQMSEEELSERREAYLSRGLDVDGRKLKGDSPQVPKTNNTQEVICAAEVNDRTMFIFRECMKEEGVTDADLVDQGGRHNSVKMVLSSCNQLLTKEETLGVLKVLMPNNWQDENIQTLVNDFYTDYYNPSQRLTLFQKRVFRESRKIDSKEAQIAEIQAQETQCELSKMFTSKMPPEIPEVLPKLVKAVTRNTPQRYKATVAQAMFPPLATYPKKLSFLYIDNQVRELRINCLIIAGTGSGKDSCTKQPLTHILADMTKRDKESRDRLKKFNEEYTSKAANKQKPQRPEDLIIQTLKYDITKAALVQRMDEAQGAPLYVRLNELEQWDKIEGSSGRGNQFTTLKLCDDEFNDFGSDRAGTQSVSASGCLHLNWNANTTEAKAYKYFRFVLTDGPISRLCLATIPEEEIGAEVIPFGRYDETYDEALKPYIDNLKAATGEIDCIQARKLTRKLKNECADFARLSQDRVFDNLTHRALVHAFRKACLLYVANGMKWEKAIEDFCRWSLYYDLYLKMMFWGDQIRHADDEIPISKRGPQNLLVLLPQEFTIEDAKRVRLQVGKTNEGHLCDKMIRTWVNRGYVIQNTEYSFKKALGKGQ